jgi:Immune inhibitor A-like, MAM domain
MTMQMRNRGLVGMTGMLAAAGLAQAQVVADGSFEAGTPSLVWTEFSTNFGTPLCDSSCLGGPPSGARTGEFWAWFGGIDTAFEQGTITQNVTIPSNAALTFYLTAFSARTDGTDFLKVFIDATEVFSVTDQQIGPYVNDYVQVTVDLSAFAGAHVLKFDSITNGGGILTNFWVDDVAIDIGGTTPTCYPNCDHSTTQPCLNVGDFSCFLNAFASGDSYANCDNSTTAPVLNVGDFSCFLNAFAGGCSAC